MSVVMFELSYKSTLDYYCSQIAKQLKDSGDPELTALLFDGLDNLVTIDANSKSLHPAVLWQSGFMTPSPKDPLYSAKFSVGVKTTNDDANYVQAKVLSKLAQHFKAEDRIEIFDYSVAPEDLDNTTPAGVMFISEVMSSPMVFDNQSGLKLLEVTAMLQRYV